MNVTVQEYGKIVDMTSPKSNTLKNCVLAFCSGGLICVGAEFIANLIENNLKMPQKDALSMVSLILIVLASLLTGLNVFDDIARFAGAGTLVPITGFSNALTAPALEYKSEGFVSGLATKIFSIAGPVLVYGIVASAIYGIIYYLFI